MDINYVNDVDQVELDSSFEDQIITSIRSHFSRDPSLRFTAAALQWLHTNALENLQVTMTHIQASQLKSETFRRLLFDEQSHRSLTFSISKSITSRAAAIRFGYKT